MKPDVDQLDKTYDRCLATGSINEKNEVDLELIKSLKEEHTVLLSSHQLHDISKLCDDITIISNGETILTGSYGELTKEKSLEDVFQETILKHEGDFPE